MFVQTVATVRSGIPPFRTCCLFEPNGAYIFKAQRGANGVSGKGPKKGAKKCVEISRERRAELNKRTGRGAPPRIPPPRLARRQPRNREGREGASSERGRRQCSFNRPICSARELIIIERLAVQASCLIPLQALLRLCKDTLRKYSSSRTRPAEDVRVTTAASWCCECIECEKPGDWIPLVVDAHHRNGSSPKCRA